MSVYDLHDKINILHINCGYEASELDNFDLFSAELF